MTYILDMLNILPSFLEINRQIKSVDLVNSSEAHESLGCLLII